MRAVSLIWEHQNKERLQHPAGTQQGYSVIYICMQVYICAELLISKCYLYPSLFLQETDMHAIHSELRLIQGQSEENEVGLRGESKPTRKNTLPGGMLEFVCISECFVCKSRSLTYLRECVGGKGAAEKHLELYENPGISTSGNRIAAYQTLTCLYAHHLAFTYCQSY